MLATPRSVVAAKEGTAIRRAVRRLRSGLLLQRRSLARSCSPNIDKSCPDHNSNEGCTRRQADCPHEPWHCCSRCGKHGHSAFELSHLWLRGARPGG